MELHVSKYDNPLWVVVAKDGMILLFTMKQKRTDCIKRFMVVWDKGKPCGNWRHWKRKGYTCQKISISIEPIKH